MPRKGYRRPPVWPGFVFEYLSQAGFEQLKREFDEFKDAKRFPRVTRISAEDFATIFVNRVIAEGRTVFLKRAA